MPIYFVQVYANTSSHFDEWSPGDSLLTHGEMRLRVVVPTPGHAPDEAFKIGNRIGQDDTGKSWPNWIRSVSVGDVVEVCTTDDKTVGFYACQRAGWRMLTPDDVEDDLTSCDRTALVEAWVAAPEQ